MTQNKVAVSVKKISTCGMLTRIKTVKYVSIRPDDDVLIEVTSAIVAQYLEQCAAHTENDLEMADDT